MSLVGYTGFSSFIKSFWYRLWHHYLVARSRSKRCRHSFIKVWVQSTVHLQLFPILHSINVFNNNNNNMSLNSFIRKRLATKSTDCESDFVRGRTSSPYKRTVKHVDRPTKQKQFCQKQQCSSQWSTKCRFAWSTEPRLVAYMSCT